MNARVGILGAGAVGSYVGGLLASHGVATTLVARGDHAAAMAAKGLHIDRRGAEPVDVAVTVATDAGALADADVVVVSVKSPDTDAAADELGGLLRGDTVVVSIQNGVGNWARLADRLPGVTVLAGVALFGVEMLTPGRIRLALPGTLVLGDPGRRHGDALDLVATLFGTALEVHTVDDLESAAWAKLVINTDMAALALCDATYPDDLADPDLHWLCRATLEEADTVVRGAGLIKSSSPISAALERKLAFLRNNPAALAALLPDMKATFRASTLQSLIRGRPHETGYLNGEVVRVAARHDMRAPINELLTRAMDARAAGAAMTARELRRSVEESAALEDPVP